MTPLQTKSALLWKPLLVCPQPEMCRRLAGALTDLTGQQVCTVTEYPASGAEGPLAKQNGCNICFLDAASDSELAQLLISELAEAMPVVALHPRNDADLILRCLRRGASEFVAEPSLEALAGVFDRLGRVRNDAGRPAGTIYCVIPGKPGCGASTLAAHLAIQLQRGGAGRVLLVDGDSLSAGISFLFKLKPEFHMEDVLRDWPRMDNDLWSRLTVPAFGVDVLAAPDDPTIRLQVSRPFAGELCTFWRERYDAVVLDLPDVRAAAECGLAALADAVLLVTTNELASLQATSRGLRYLEAGGGDRSKLRLILNRYTPANGLERRDVKTALSVQPFATVCNDYEAIQAALLEGKPAAADSRYAASLQALCRQLCPAAAGQQRSKSWLSSLLRRK
jgi:pilus assembly protein CpaE